MFSSSKSGAKSPHFKALRAEITRVIRGPSPFRFNDSTV
jgi:hypothetical protein